MSADLRRSLILACGGLLCGFALVVILYATSDLFRRGIGGQEAALPSAALPGTKDTATPESRSAESPAASGSPVTPLAGREEGASTTPGKSLPNGQGVTGQGITGQAGAPRPSQDQGQAPTFDIIRVEPTGETVIAGRGAPNTTVEMLRDNHPIARALIDPSGQFAIVPPALPAGSSEITLRSIGADGQGRKARESVAVVVAADRTTKPLIALTSPDRPTVVLSQPDPPATRASDATAAAPVQGEAGRAVSAGVSERTSDTAATKAPGGAGAAPALAGADKAEPAPVKVVSVDAEEGGRLFVTGQAPPGATVRLYINETLIAPGSVGPDGRVAFTIGRGVAPGDYRIRLDQVDPVSGKVKTRSEVAFAVPRAAKSGLPAVPGAAPPNGVAALAPSLAPSKPSPSGAGAARPHGKLAGNAVQGDRSVQGMPQGAPQDASPSAPASPMTTGRSQAGPTTDEAGASARAGADTPARAPSLASALAAPRTVFVPEISTATITRGDSLWQISRRTYGRGGRFTVIFDANQPQIRNPDLIYPGQVFVLPSDGSAAVPLDRRRG